MRNVLACLGAIVLLGLFAIGGCAVWGYTAWKKMEAELPAVDAEVRACVILYNDGHYGELYDRAGDVFRAAAGTRAQCVDKLTTLKERVGTITLGERTNFAWNNVNASPENRMTASRVVISTSENVEKYAGGRMDAADAGPGR